MSSRRGLRIAAFVAGIAVLALSAAPAAAQWGHYWMWGNYYGPVPSFYPPHSDAWMYYAGPLPGISYGWPAASSTVSYYFPGQQQYIGQIEVRLPAHAQLWFDDFQTTQKGEDRTFYTPPLEPGRRYIYRLRARWNDGSRDVDQTRTVTFTPGRPVVVNFTQSTGENPARSGASEDTEQRTLFERLGGEQGIRALIDDVVPRVENDPRVNFARKGTPHQWKPTPQNVAQLKKYLVEYIAHATGGPEKYEGESMKAAHKGMEITNQEFKAMLDDVKASMSQLNIPPREQQDLLKVLESTRKSIVGD